MRVPYIDLVAQFRDNLQVRQVIEEILSSGQFILGSRVEEFERNFARLCGTKWAVGLSSGTDALFLSLKVLGIGEGDEVITVPNSFLSTVGVITTAGAFPRLVDVDKDYNLDPEFLEEVINDKTRAIIPVHLTGTPARMGEINAVARKYGLAVIEDAAQAVDAELNGKKVGGLGDFGAFSLHPLKNLNTCGDGGVLTMNSEEHYQKLLLLRNHGLKNRNESVVFAFNSRLDALKAAVANTQIAKIGEVTEKRNRYARIYDQGLASLAGRLTIPPRRKEVVESFHTYVVQVEDRDGLTAFLNSKGVETKIHYPIPIHLMKAASHLGYGRGDFPVAERQAERIISLPIHQFLIEDQLEYVIDAIYSFYGMKRG